MLDGKTRDLIKDNIQLLKQIFPEVFVEDKIDFEKLQLLLGEDIVNDTEKYQFTWKGKTDAIKLSLSQNTGTLRPDKESSKNWDTTQNLYIEGDNLEVLRALQDTYRGKIKMIYIDPPYNTGKDFVYKDDFVDNVESYKQKMGENLKSNPETNGRYHTDWLNMIYPRLKLARNLLKDDGVIFISIDDNEVHNLRKVCDEIFGEENFVGEIARISKRGGNKGDLLKPKKDYILFYGKNLLEINQSEYGYKISEDTTIQWIEEDFNNIKRKYIQGDIPYREKLDVRANQRYYIEAPDGSLIIPKGNIFPNIKKDGSLVKPQSDSDKCWTWSLERYLEEKKNNRFIFKQSNNSPFLDENNNHSKWTIYKKVFYDEYINKIVILSDLIEDCENMKGTKELQILGIPFDFSKPSLLVLFLSKIATNSNDIILDFFSGSGTTAHAVMQLNVEDGGNRKFIMVQIPEETATDSEAYKSGYKNICEIGKERIRRAGEQIITNYEGQITNYEGGIRKLDVGFKVFKLDTTNLKKWDPNNVDIKGQLEFLVNPLKEDRTMEDVLYEIMLKYGLDLTLPIVEKQISNKIIYSIAENYMVAYLEKGINAEIVDAIAKINPKVVIFYDGCFGDDVSKLNILHQLQEQGIQVRVI